MFIYILQAAGWEMLRLGLDFLKNLSDDISDNILLKHIFT